MQKTFIISDIHGSYKALKQCLERSGFSYEDDRLICLGDVCDRRDGVKDCMDELLKIKKLIMIMGNHDLWALQWMEKRKVPSLWASQGGRQTKMSYKDGVPGSHIELLRNAVFYHVEDNMLFVHGGIDHKLPLKAQEPEAFLWNRSLVHTAMSEKDQSLPLSEYDTIFLGHTPTINYWDDDLPAPPDPPVFPTPFLGKHIHYKEKATERSSIPVQLCNVTMMDTGAGWSGGRLSIMNLETREVFQSDVLP